MQGVSCILTMADTFKTFIMYALIENHKVIRVFEEIGMADQYGDNGQTVVPVNKLALFYLYGGAVVLGELCREMVDFGVEGDWIILTDECSYELSEVDYWQPIGEWLSF